MDTHLFESRKRDHMELSMQSQVQAKGLSGLDRYCLVHDALPEINFDAVKINSLRLGQSAQTPFYVSGMTAGHKDGQPLNEVLAEVCQERNWAMGLGSQRRDLEDPKSKIDDWKKFRQRFPRLILFGNLGLSQLQANQRSIDAVKAIVDTLKPQALCIHLNALQEVIQPEGTPHFAGGLAAIGSFVEKLGIPVLLKETGCGFSHQTLRKLKSLQRNLPVAIDVAGLGGTHWGRIEGLRAQGHTLQAQAAETFSNWGISTVDSVLAVKSELPQMEIWASGGVRNGLDAAKLIALGAVQVGYAQPALAAALQGRQTLSRWMEQQEFELKVALFCTGSTQPAELSEARGNDSKIWKITTN